MSIHKELHNMMDELQNIAKILFHLKSKMTTIYKQLPKHSSSRWDEAQQTTAICDFQVKYMRRQLIQIHKGEYYYEDKDGNVLVGYNGSLYPPVDERGHSLIDDDSEEENDEEDQTTEDEESEEEEDRELL
jgi:hypothetical protein